MKQVVQNLNRGEIILEDVAVPLARAGHLLIQSRATLISAGTERMLVEFGKASLLAKARSQPEKVRQVLDKIKSDGLLPTLEAVFARLDEPMPLGYCNAGVVIGVGEGVDGFEVGDRVISNGPHAEIVCVPMNLCAKIPGDVPDEHAAFCVLSSIALQGIRLLSPTLGERIVVSGLGLIGLIAVQLLRASGCEVLGIDLDARKLELARQFGAQTVDLSTGADPVTAAMAFSEGRGVDGVLITASAKSSEIVHQAAAMSRKRGRLILVGVVGLELRRSDFYEKELSFQVSCSYGPGRYDSTYELQGQDYPFAFVRWTEQRNFEAILAMLGSGRLDVTAMIDRSAPLSDAAGIYDDLATKKDTLGLILTYPEEKPDLQRTITLTGEQPPAQTRGERRACVGVIGAGNYAKLMLLPAFAKTPAVLKSLASASGVSGTHVGRKFGFQQTTTDYHSLLADTDINTVVIVTRHNMHAKMTVEALEAGKHVFVEKPLALAVEELKRIEQAYAQAGDRQLLVGFNRRFSPHTVKMKELLSRRAEPMCMVMTVNAGFIPPDHWTHDPKVGGGRIIGEACHWIDLLAFLTDHPVTAVQAAVPSRWDGVGSADDKMTMTLWFADGSLGTIHYLANGDKGFPKERLDVFCEQRILQLDNFKRLQGYGYRGFRSFKTSRVDKGQNSETSAFVERVAKGGPLLVSIEGLVNTTLASFAAVESARSGQRVCLNGLGRGASQQNDETAL
ncbi:MAG: bi-domain-containing oxidoreductase [Phycisphaerales bacterium]|nr:bi-domain-containing oxidoreductase [Phycisphaerales bacterium]